jgi:hypothetical protein
VTGPAARPAGPPLGDPATHRVRGAGGRGAIGTTPVQSAAPGAAIVDREGGGPKHPTQGGGTGASDAGDMD